VSATTSSNRDRSAGGIGQPVIAAGFVPGGPTMTEADWPPLVKE
jgi:hypothetical protein